MNWHLQICRIMRQISDSSSDCILSYNAFDWLNISGNYFSNDFSFSLLSSCRISMKGPGDIFIIMDVFAQMRGGEKATGELDTRKGEKSSSFYSVSDFICSYFSLSNWLSNIATGSHYVSFFFLFFVYMEIKYRDL